MDDQALVTIHGGTILPAATADRPLVTLAIFTFNQERFIREAVDAALAQTYTPLEIILTDDCSSDGTPEILEEVVAAYRGPHRVIVRRGLKNFGTLTHVLYAASLARGEIFAVGAGDDVSLPERTARIVAAFASSDAQAFSSDEYNLDAEGVVTPMSEQEAEQRRVLHEKNPAWLHGATAAYRTTFLKMLPAPDYPVLFEDLVAREILSALGMRSVRSSERLIRYRQHDANIYKKDEGASLSDDRKYIEWSRIYASYRYCEDYLSSVRLGRGNCPATKVNLLAYIRIKLFRHYFSVLHSPLNRSLKRKLVALGASLLLRNKDYRIFRMTVRELFLR